MTKTHKEKMARRKLVRAARVPTEPKFELVPIFNTYRFRKVWNLRPIKSGKYDPATEDRKHKGNS